MALRIAGMKGMMKPPVEEPSMPSQGMEEEMMETPAEDTPQEESLEDDSDEGLDQEIAGYRGPEQGPFECGYCEHYIAGGSCKVVAGHIDEKGICNVFTPMKDSQESPQDQAEPASDEVPEVMPEEVPEEE